MTVRTILVSSIQNFFVSLLAFFAFVAFEVQSCTEVLFYAWGHSGILHLHKGLPLHMLALCSLFCLPGVVLLAILTQFGSACTLCMTT